MSIQRQNTDTAYFIFCQQCGFYPSGEGDVAVGHTEESKAENVARMHSGGSHRTFVVPESWMGSKDTRVRT